MSEASRKVPALLQRDQRADRARRMAGQRDQHDACRRRTGRARRRRIDRRPVIPLGRADSPRLGVRRARRLDLLFVDHDGRALEERVAAAMVGMQVRAHHDVDIVGSRPTPASWSSTLSPGAHDRRHDLRHARPSAPPDRSATDGWQPVSNSTLPCGWRSRTHDTGNSIVSLRSASGT